MKVVYIPETNEYYLVNGLTELNYEKFSFSVSNIWAQEGRNIHKFMTVIDVHTSEDGRLVYAEKEGTWYWHVFNEPRKGFMGGFMNQSMTYNEIEVIERIPLINMMQKSVV